MIDEKFYDSRERLKDVSFDEMLQGTNIETSFGKEFIIDMDGSEVVPDLHLHTIIKTQIGNKNALIKNHYYGIDEHKNGRIFMDLAFEGDKKYESLMKRATYVNSYNKLEENIKWEYKKDEEGKIRRIIWREWNFWKARSQELYSEEQINI